MKDIINFFKFIFYFINIKKYKFLILNDKNYLLQSSDDDFIK